RVALHQHRHEAAGRLRVRKGELPPDHPRVSVLVEAILHTAPSREFARRRGGVSVLPVGSQVEPRTRLARHKRMPPVTWVTSWHKCKILAWPDHVDSTERRMIDRPGFRVLVIAGAASLLLGGCATRGALQKAMTEQRTALGTERTERVAADSA